MRRKIGITCIVLSIVLLLAAVGLLCYNTWQSGSAGEASQAVLAQIQEEAPRQTAAPEDPYADHVDAFDEEAKEMTVKQIDGYGYVGYLSLPALQLELPVMAECDYERLKIAPCRDSGATKTDDIVIAAHNYSTHFGKISQLIQGDLLTFTDMDGQTILYEVSAIDILEPTAGDIVRSGTFDLVLYTCTYGGEQRVVVFCNRVEA